MLRESLILLLKHKIYAHSRSIIFIGLVPSNAAPLE